MASMLLLSLCLVTVIHVTSSQSTHDVTQHETDVTSCGRTEQALNQLMTTNNQLMMMNSQLMNAVSQLQRDVAELKTDRRQKDARGEISIMTFIGRIDRGYIDVLTLLDLSAAFDMVVDQFRSYTDILTRRFGNSDGFLDSMADYSNDCCISQLVDLRTSYDMSYDELTRSVKFLCKLGRMFLTF